MSSAPGDVNDDVLNFSKEEMEDSRCWSRSLSIPEDIEFKIHLSPPTESCEFDKSKSIKVRL